MDPLTIEVFADVRCPFTHVGLKRFVERREAAGRSDIRLWIRAWPLELVNGEPIDAALVAEEVDALRAQVAPDLFKGFRPDRFGTTSLPALELAAAAYDESLPVGEQVGLRLRAAVFEDGRDISDIAVLNEIADATGVAGTTWIQPQRVLSDWREGRRRGVRGSPHFFVAGEAFFCPSLDIQRDSDGLRITVDDDGLESFLTRCFPS